MHNYYNSSVRTANKHDYEFAVHFDITGLIHCNIALVIDKLASQK